MKLDPRLLRPLVSDSLMDEDMESAPGDFDPLPGRYRFLRKVGAGGWGVVWAARDLNLGRLVAIKVISPERAEVAIQVLRNEGVQLAKLRPHPNIVQVHSWEQVDGMCLVILQYVDGGSVGDQLRSFGPLDWPQAARYVADVADGLQRVHENGLLHRDIKPDNFLVDVSQDLALLTDFGFAGTVEEMAHLRAGTPGFAAPEAFDAGAVSASDVFSLAASLYAMAKGNPPFTGDTLEEVVAQTRRGLSRTIPEDLLPLEVREAVRACLEPVHEQRPSLKEFRDGLRGALNRFTADTVLGLEETGRTGPAPSIELQVLKVMPDGRALPIVPADRPGESRRDLAYVARRPPSVRVLNGDSLRFRVSAGADGFVTLLNVGPTGTLSVLVPNPDLPELRVRSGVSVHFPPPEAGEIEVRPPEGPERIIAIWTRHRPGLAPEELYRRVMSGEAVPSDAETYCSTRQLVYVSRKLRELDPADATWRLVEIDHKRA